MTFINLKIKNICKVLTGILFAGVGLIILRYRHPDRERPIKISLPIPILFVGILVVLISTSAVTDVDNVITSVKLVGTAVPAYIFGVLWKKKPTNFNRRYNSYARALQKIFHVILEEHVD